MDFDVRTIKAFETPNVSATRALAPEALRTNSFNRNSPPIATLAGKFATLEWVWWFNHQRLLEPLGYVPPAEFEEQFHRSPATHVAAAALT
jgi:transposase InsO family protein